MYPEKLLTKIYKFFLKLTKKRGAITLAKIDCFLFREDRKIKIDSNNNIYLNLPPDPHFFGYLVRTHEIHIEHLIRNFVVNGDVVIDIGANIGYFCAQFLNAVGQQGVVYCIEPERSNFNYLNINCLDWNKHGYQIKSYQMAVSDQNGELNLNIHRHSTYHSLENSNINLDKIEGVQKVSVVTLDSWTTQERIDSISLLKVDTEGHEIKVLEGATRLFSSGKVHMVILECRDDKTAGFIDNFAEKYQFYQYVYNGSNWIKSEALPVKNRLESFLVKKPIPLNLLNQS